MSRNGFIVLLLLTVAAIGVGAIVAERFAEPGIGRTLIVGKDGALTIDLEDDIVKACLMRRDGQLLRA